MSKLAKTFFGRKEYRIDPKGRIPLSADYYSKLGLSEKNDTIIVTCSPHKKERYLEIFSEEQWEKEQSVIENMEEGANSISSGSMSELPNPFSLTARTG